MASLYRYIFLEFLTIKKLNFLAAKAATCVFAILLLCTINYGSTVFTIERVWFIKYYCFHNLTNAIHYGINDLGCTAKVK